MIINNSFNTTNNIYPAAKPSSVSSNRINFCANVKPDKFQSLLSSGLKKLGDFNPNNYRTLTKSELTRLRAEYANLIEKTDDNSLKDLETVHDIVTDNMKEYFDRKFGEGKYSVIIIGRSLSSVGKVLGYKIGKENVHNIPLTRAENYQMYDYIEEARKRGELDVLRNYLKSVGLSQGEIEKSGKTYIITDYCFTGASLKGAWNLLTEHDLLGHRNIEMVDVSKTIPDKALRNYFNHDLKYSSYKDYSFVEQSRILKDTEKHIIDPQKADIKTKLVWFKLLDNYMTQTKQVSKLKTEPQKESFLDSVLNFLFP